jgi:hypothetical protein
VAGAADFCHPLTHVKQAAPLGFAARNVEPMPVINDFDA